MKYNMLHEVKEILENERNGYKNDYIMFGTQSLKNTNTIQWNSDTTRPRTQRGTF